MSRHDDALRETARDRLATVAGRSSPAGPSLPTGRSAVRGSSREEPAADPLAWLRDAAGGPAAATGTRHGRHRDDGGGPGAPDGRAPDGRAPDGRAWDDRAPDDRASDDGAPDGRAPDDGAPDGRAWDDRAPDDRDREARASEAPDARDVVARMRAEALGSAAAGYANTYGHPLEHGRPAPRPPGVRWGLTVRHAVVASAAVAVLATGVAVRAASAVPEEPQPVPAAVAPAGAGATGTVGPPGAGAAAAGAPGPPATAQPGGTPAAAGPPGTPVPGDGAGPEGVVVHVVGQVAAPGVFRLPVGARVGDALQAAGGAAPSADLSAVNLARVLQDGEQVVVPAPGEVPVAPPSGGAPGGAPALAGTPLDLNAADATALDALPGIGPVLADRILGWRTENGPFRDVEELGEVPGIGEALMGRLRSLVRV